MIVWSTEAKELFTLAIQKFPDLNESELKLLCAAATGEFAYCGHSDVDRIPATDPAYAEWWEPNRTVRAALVRWLCTSVGSKALIDWRGIRLHASRIVGKLDLSFTTVPFPLVFAYCLFEEVVDLTDAQLIFLHFEGSRTRSIVGDRLTLRGDLNLRQGFKAQGEIRLPSAAIGGNFDCTNGAFQNPGAIALFADQIRVKGSALFRDGFFIDGQIRMLGAQISGQLTCDGVRFSRGSSMDAQQMVVKGSFFWRNVEWNCNSQSHGNLTKSMNPAPIWLNLAHTTVGPMGDDDRSWPSDGRLSLHGFAYSRFGKFHPDIKSRLRWLSGQVPGYWPQPYQQFAKLLRDSGDDGGARDVLYAMEESRRKDGNLSKLSLAWAWVLKVTSGYGYRPLRAGLWVLFFVVLGTFIFSWGYDAGVITQTGQRDIHYEPFNPFVYSFETFIPLVDLQQAKHWLPQVSTTPKGPVDLLGPLSNFLPTKLNPNLKHQFGSNMGERLRLYVWAHVVVGWLFAGMFVAGVTRALRRD